MLKEFRIFFGSKVDWMYSDRPLALTGVAHGAITGWLSGVLGSPDVIRDVFWAYSISTTRLWDSFCGHFGRQLTSDAANRRFHGSKGGQKGVKRVETGVKYVSAGVCWRKTRCLWQHARRPRVRCQNFMWIGLLRPDNGPKGPKMGKRVEKGRKSLQKRCNCGRNRLQRRGKYAIA